jgi:hypothetical protein
MGSGTTRVRFWADAPTAGTELTFTPPVAPPQETWAYHRTESEIFVGLTPAQPFQNGTFDSPGTTVPVTAHVQSHSWQVWRSNFHTLENPRELTLNDSSGPAIGAEVSFAVEGTGQISSGFATTNTSGDAVVTLTTGSSASRVNASVSYNGTTAAGSVNFTPLEWQYSHQDGRIEITLIKDPVTANGLIATVDYRGWQIWTRGGQTQIRNEWASPAIGADVTFGFVNGSGTLTPEAQATNGDGRVRCQYSLTEGTDAATIGVEVNYNGTGGSKGIDVTARHDGGDDDGGDGIPETWTDDRIDVAVSVTVMRNGTSTDGKSADLSAIGSCTRTQIQVSNRGGTRSFTLSSDVPLSYSWSIASGDARISSGNSRIAIAQLGREPSMAQVSVTCEGQSEFATVELPAAPREKDDDDDDDDDDDSPGDPPDSSYSLSFRDGGFQLFKPGETLPTETIVYAAASGSEPPHHVNLVKVSGSGTLDETNLDLTSEAATTKLSRLQPGRTIIKGSFFDSQGALMGVATAEVAIVQGAISEVSFTGAHCHTIKSDDGNVTYSTPQWKDGDDDGIMQPNPDNATAPDHNYPIAYTQNTTPEIGATFKIAGIGDFPSVKVRAKLPNGMWIKEISPTPAADTLTLPPTQVTKGFASDQVASFPSDVIAFYKASDPQKAFTLAWEIKFGDYGWRYIGTTSHTVYVTWKDPIGTAKILAMESLFNIGCRNAQGPRNNEQTIVEAIYVQFMDVGGVHPVKKATGDLSETPLTYWSPGGTSSTSDLLASGDSQCGGWAMFLIDVLRAQGLAHDAKVIQVLPAAPSGRAALDAATAHAGIGGTFDYDQAIDIAPLDGAPDRVVFYIKNWNISDSFYPYALNGIRGQTNDDPKSLFSDHALVQFAGKYYDPSYGSIPVATLAEWEDASVDGFGMLIPASMQSGAAYHTVFKWVWRPNTTNMQECSGNVLEYVGDP